MLYTLDLIASQPNNANVAAKIHTQLFAAGNKIKKELKFQFDSHFKWEKEKKSWGTAGLSHSVTETRLFDIKEATKQPYSVLTLSLGACQASKERNSIQRAHVFKLSLIPNRCV